MVALSSSSILLFLLLFGIGKCVLSSPSRDSVRPNFQTDFVVLFTDAVSNMSNAIPPYRNQTYVVTLTSGAISTTNRIQACLGIVRNFFDFTSSQFQWDVSIPLYTSTTMNIEAYANGSNIINALAISYLISSNLLFQINYVPITFALTDDVVAGTNVDPNCTISQSTPNKSCVTTSETINYAGGVAIDTTQNPTIQVFISGVSAERPGDDNIGWKLTNANPGSTSFTITAIAFGTLINYSESTTLYYIAFYYVVYQKTTVQSDATSVLLDGSLSYGCWYTITAGNCSTPPDTQSITGAGPVYTPYMYILGFSSLYATAVASNFETGFFNVSSSSVNGNNYDVVLYYSGNSNNDYKMTFSYIIYQKISCAGYAVDVYLTLDRQYCNQTCNGGIGQYFDGNSWCQSCDPICYSCSSVSTACTGCYTASQYRVLSGSTCICNTGYFDNGVNIVCVPCHYSCTQCTSSTFSSCTACDLAVDHRQILGNACPCIVNYYDSGVTICSSCYYSCWSCSASGSSACLSCNSSLWYRTLSASSCLCNTGYYDNGVSICSLCHYSCLTCSGGSSSTNCATCLASAHRYQSGSSCPCNAIYYDVGPGVMTCGMCDPTCYTCNGPLNTNCLSCNSSLYRGFVLNRCDCITHYYAFGGLCYPCDYSCGNCTGGANTQCSTCISGNFRTLTSTSCPCDFGYYDIGVAGCLICDYSCLGCITSSTNCLACNASNFRTQAGNTCPCNPGYVDTLVSMCSICQYSCVTCSSILNTGCITCDNTQRYLNGGKCLCFTHTYDNGVNSTCGTCSYTCQNCTNMFTTSCTTCVATDLRTISGGNSCPCNARYYDAGIATCQSCHFSCLTCSGTTSTNCLTCSAGDFRSISVNSCLCMSHYYQNGVTICPTCLATCLTCTAFSTCLTCDSVTNHRSLSGTNCICQNGYFDTGATVCATCAYQCLTCVTSSTNCLSCNTTALRTLGSATCLCNYGYYDAGVTMCALCYYSCDSCSGGLSSNCLTCNSTALRFMSGTSCVCPAGYYDNGSAETCQICYFKCQNCSSFAVCSTCDATLYRSLSLGTCACITGYYDTGVTMCSQCYPTCITCNGGLINNCLTCNAAANRIFSSFQCMCRTGYYEAGSNTCAACSYTCLNCSGSSTSCTACNYTNQRYFLSNTCPCNVGYFDNGAGMCAICDSTCSACTSTSTNCLSCNTTQLTILSGNTCICLSTNYLNTTNGICYPCNGYCVTCTAGTNTSCMSCSAALHRAIWGNTCLCIGGYYEVNIPMCSTCDPSCLTCFGGSSFNCSSCNPGYTLFTSTCIAPLTCANYYLDGQCVNTCPNYTYPSANICMKCTNNCYTCASAIMCLTCQTGYKFQPSNSTCNIACTQMQYQNNTICYGCPLTCQTCLILNASVLCTTCNTSYNFYQGSCLLTCPVNVTIAQSGVCIPCVKPCLTCFGITSQQCLTCILNYTMLGTECLANCPVGMFSSSLTTYCEFCPSNCTTCIEGSTANSSYCTGCISSLYPSNGICIGQGYFMGSGGIVQCHPNCQTCTNSSFSSCIKCKPLRGDSNLQAILGYCDCQAGSIDIGNGVCDVQLYKSISTANSFLVSSSASVFGTSFAVGLVTSNFLNFERFMGYNQIISQYYYLNASIPASTDIVFQYLGMSNVGNFLQNYGENQPLTRRRLLYDNSTQSLESLFLHRHNSYYVYTTCLHIIVANVFVWLVILFVSYLIPCMERCYENKPTKCLKKTIKIFKYWASLFKYQLAVKLILLTATETAFNVAISLKLTDFGQLQTHDIINFCLSCLIGIFYLAVLIRLFVVSCVTTQLNKKDPYNVLFSEFKPVEKQKWYRTAYIPLLILRCILLQVLIVVLSFNPFYQTCSTCGIQFVFLIYTILCNPYVPPWSICVYLTELVLTAQIAILTVISYVAESERLEYTFILIGLNYAQMAIFGVFCLSSVMRMIYNAIVECRNQSKIYAEEVSEHSSDADLQKQIDQQNENFEKQANHQEIQQNESQFGLKEQDIPSVQDIQPDSKIKKRYRVQKRRNVFDED